MMKLKIVYRNHEQIGFGTHHRFGLIDENDDWIVHPIYEWIRLYHSSIDDNHTFDVKYNDKWYFNCILTNNKFYTKQLTKTI